jgi:hypothetical protein
MKKYVETKKISGATHIKVRVYFDDGTTSRIGKKGIYLSITPTNYRTFTFNGVEYCEESFDCRLQGSIGLLKALSRKNSKLLAKYEEKFWDRAEDIARCFEDNDGNELYTLITKINSEL